MLSHQKLFILALLIFRYPLDKDSHEFTKFELYMQQDLPLCPQCFENQSEFCARLRHEYEFDEGFTTNLNVFFGVRHTRQLRQVHNTSHRVFAKYLARDFDLTSVRHSNNEPEAIRKLSAQFFNESRLDGLQFCPQFEIDRFVDTFGSNYSRLSIWTHLNVDMQPILLPHLKSLGFPVPETIGSCGFTTFQSDDGVPLADLYSAEFSLKLKIAAGLVEGALRFSEGFDGFRIYITDLNMDNVVYSAAADRVSFVDLDTVLIVDGRKHSASTHRHEYVECDDCFAFSPSDICAHDRSDLNLFAACQLLQEDLRKDRTKGFLYPVPEEYADLQLMLGECVGCPPERCQNRFEIAVKFFERLKEIIKVNL